MNGEKTLFVSPWRKGFLIFLQRQQDIVFRQSGLIQWSDSFRKSLENIYLASMAHRIENKHLPWNYAIVLTLPIIFRNPLRSQTYGKYQTFGDKGITADRNNIRDYPGAVFQKGTNFIQGGIKPARYRDRPVISQRREIFDPMQVYFLYTIPHTIPRERIRIVYFPRTWRMPVVNQDSIRSEQSYRGTGLKTVDGAVQYERADSGMMRNRTALGTGELGSNMDQIQRDQRPNYFRETEKINSPEVPRNLLLKPDKLNLRYEYKGKSTGRIGRMGGVSFTHKEWLPVVNLDTIRSMKPYQIMASRAAYGDVQYEMADSGTVGSLISGAGEFRPNMEQLYRDQRRSYFGGANDQNFSEISENLLLEPENLHLKNKEYKYKYKGKFNGRTGRASLTLRRQILMINQDAIGFMKHYKKAAPNQRAALKSLHGDMAHEDMTYDKANSGMERGLDTGPGEFGSGPVVPFRQERADSIQADAIYAISPWTQAKTKRVGGRFDSILTSDKIQGYPRPVSLNTVKTEREMSLYEITQTQNPIWGKREPGKTGASIDYNKVADRVYEILTRRIIREKERMGELI